MEKARCNTELYSNLRAPLNNVKPSNFWGSHHFSCHVGYDCSVPTNKRGVLGLLLMISLEGESLHDHHEESCKDEVGEDRKEGNREKRSAKSVS